MQHITSSTRFFFSVSRGGLQGWKVGMKGGGGNEWIGVHDVKFNQLEPIQSCKKKVPWTKWCPWLGLRSGIYLKNKQTNGLDNNSQSGVYILTIAKTQHKHSSTIWSSEKSANTTQNSYMMESAYPSINKRMDKRCGKDTRWDLICQKSGKWMERTVSCCTRVSYYVHISS